MIRFEVAHTWDGKPLPAPAASLTLHSDLRLEVEAPFHGAPPPPGPAGAFWTLWEHEVVELFLLGDDARYLEVELSPHGHHLVLVLHGQRKVVTHSLPLAYTATVRGDRWRGEAQLDPAWRPRGPLWANAYAIWGPRGARQHAAWSPVPGPKPDFHRLSCFRPIVL